jgi:3'-phosphoadenosine 5'-phosphosulfate sulfotransferase (PAPS reductase)/FAD synthetase
MKILNYSGGKDSTALLLKLKSLNALPDKIVFADTELEFPEMYIFLEKVEKKLGISIERTKPKYSWDEWFYGKWVRGKWQGRIRGFPCVVTSCWHKRHAKQVPLDKYSKDAEVVYVGYNADEIKRNLNGSKFKFPLKEYGLTAQDCIKLCKENDLLNPLYNKGFKRIGCWLCPKQNKQSLNILKRDYPDLWEKLLKYEQDSPQGFQPNFHLKMLKEADGDE